MGAERNLKPFEKFAVVKSENARHVLRVWLLYFPPWCVKLEAMNVPGATGRPRDNVKVVTVCSALPAWCCSYRRRKHYLPKFGKSVDVLVKKKEERDILVRGSCFSQYKSILKQTLSFTNFPLCSSQSVQSALLSIFGCTIIPSYCLSYCAICKF